MTLPQINSSPANAPPTGRDGLMRSRAGGGAGFEVSITHSASAMKFTRPRQLDNERETDVDKFIDHVRFTLKVLEEQRTHYTTDPRFLDRAMHVFRPVTKWAEDVRHHETRRSMPVTNGDAKSRRTLPVNLIGYKYMDRDN